MRVGQEKQHISPEAFELLEVIVSNNISKIDYNHPEKTLGEYFEQKNYNYKNLIEELKNFESGYEIICSKVGFVFFGREFCVKYVIGEKIKELYDKLEAKTEKIPD